MGTAVCKPETDSNRNEDSFKILLLGPGESGKTTVLKQIRILHGSGYRRDELLSYVSSIRNHIFESIETLVAAMDQLEIPFGSSENEFRARVLVRATAETFADMSGLEEIAESIESVWNDTGLKECYARRSEFQLNDNTDFQAKRIFEEHYVPTGQDLLNCRVQTTGIVEHRIQYQSHVLRFIDVGGQKSQRRKWMHCFDDVNAILFIVAISEFDLTTREDPTKNRLIDGLELFSGLCNSVLFCKTDVIIFFNKFDLFEQKLKTVSLSQAFPDFVENHEKLSKDSEALPNSMESSHKCAATFVSVKFKRKNRYPGRFLYSHFTCAIDTNQIKVILQSVLNSIVEKNLKALGLRI